MKYVEIYKLENNGSQRIIATCTLQPNDTVICDGQEVFIQNLAKEGINDYAQEKPTKLFLKDGLKFLEQLRFNFKSGYLNASKIKEQ